MPSLRAVNPVGLALIRRREGCRLQAYEDEKSLRLPPEKKYWTIGWGHTGPDVKPGLEWSQREADDHFEADVNHFAAGVARALRVHVTDNQFAALVSLAFNIGLGAFVESMLLLALNRGDFVSAGNHFLDFKYTDHHLSANLLERRKLERQLFMADLGPPRVA